MASPTDETYGTKRLIPSLNLSVDVHSTDFTKVPNHRNVEPLTSFNATKTHADSSDYSEGADCIAQYPWQMESRPSCNTVHEIGLRIDSSSLNGDGASVSLINNGYRRDVWSVQVTSHADHENEEEVEQVVLKTQRAEHLFSASNFDHNRVDAMTMEHLTPSHLRLLRILGNL